jgi:hypothetical protein
MLVGGMLDQRKDEQTEAVLDESIKESVRNAKGSKLMMMFGTFGTVWRFWIQ